MMKKSLLALTLASFVLGACGGGATSNSASSDASSSVTSSSSTITPTTSVMELVAPISEGNFTFRLVQDEVEVYQIKLDGTLIYAEINNPEMAQSMEVFLDITDEDQPMLYAPAEGVEGAWVKSLSDPISLFFLLFPLSIIDVEALQDVWFTYDTALNTFFLDMEYIGEVMGNSNNEGLESLSIQGNASEVIITLTGVNVDTDQPMTVVVSYSDIGTTTVTLPTNLIDPTEALLETVVQGSTNHEFNVYLYEGTAEDLENGTEVLFQNNSRDGAFWIANAYRTIGEETTFETTYYGTTETGYESIVALDQSPAVQTAISEEAYQAGLESFYPIQFTDIQFDWLSETDEFSFAGTPFLRLDPSHYDHLVNASFFPENAVIEDVLVSAATFFGEAMLTISIEVSFGEGQWMRMDLDIGEFGLAVVERPFLPEDALNLSEMLDLLVSTQSYSLDQVIELRDGSGAAIYDLGLSREGDAYSLIDLFSPNYTYQNGVYEQYTFDYEVSDLPLREVISQEQYEAAVIQPQWLNVDLLTSSMISVNPDNPNQGTLNAGDFYTLIDLSDQAVEIVNYYRNEFQEPVTEVSLITIEEVRLESESGEGYNNLYVEIDCTLEGYQFGSLELTLYATYYGIGSTTVYIPTEYRS